MADRVYLDWNATTPLRPEARAAMAAALELPGNPSSVHAEGRQARRLVEDARAAVAAAVGALATERGLHVRRNRSERVGAQPRRPQALPASPSSGFWSRPSSTSRCSPAGGLPRTRSSNIAGHAVGRRRSRRVSGRPDRRRSSRWSRSCGQQRDRRAPADRMRRPRSSMRRAGCCMSTRSRRLEKYHSISKI